MLSTSVAEEGLAAIDAGLDCLLATDWDALSVAEQLRRLEHTETVMRRLRSFSHTGIGRVALADPAELADKPVNLVATKLRISPREARKRINTGALMCQRQALTGEPVAPILEHVAPHWHAGELDEEHVDVITTMLRDLPADVPFDKRQRAQSFLAETATTVRPDELRTLANRLAVTLNPDGAFSDVDRARRRGITIGRQRADGMSPLTGLLNPELRATLDALLGRLAAPGMCNPDDQTPRVDGEPDDQWGVEGAQARRRAHRMDPTTPTRTTTVHQRFPPPGAPHTRGGISGRGDIETPRKGRAPQRGTRRIRPPRSPGTRHRRPRRCAPR